MKGGGKEEEEKKGREMGEGGEKGTGEQWGAMFSGREKSPCAHVQVQKSNSELNFLMCE